MPTRPHATPASLGQTVRGFGALFLLPHTVGILLLALMTYASMLSLRGLWLGPLLIDRHGYTLVASGHVATAMSLVSLFSPAFFGRMDPGPGTRRRWLTGFTVLMAALFAAMACGNWRGWMWRARWRWVCCRATWCCSMRTCARPTRRP